jgi:WD40 repeat protein
VGCGVGAILLLGFGITVGLVVYASMKSDESAANREPEAVAVKTPPGERDRLPSTPPSQPRRSEDRGDQPDRPPVNTPTQPNPPAKPDSNDPPPPEPGGVLTKSLAAMDRLTIAVAPPKPEEGPTPEVWAGHTATIRGVAYTDDGRFVVSVSGAIEKNGKEDNSIRIWDARRGKQVRKLDGFREALDAVSVSPGGRFAVFGHSGHYEGEKWIDATDHDVRMWDLQENQIFHFRKDTGAGSDKAEARFKGLDSSVFSTAFAPDRKRVVGVANSGKLVLWDARGGQTVVDSKVVAIARPRSDGGALFPINFTLSGLTSIQFTLDGRWLLAGGADYSVRLIDAQTGEQVHNFESHQDIVWAVATSRSKTGRNLGLSGGGSRQKLKTFGFVDGAKDYAIRLWDLETREQVRRFVGHELDVMSLVFCPNGRHILSTGMDKTVRLWDLETGTMLRTYRGHTEGVRSISVSPDGRTAVSGGNDCTIRYWRLPATLEELVRALEKKDRAALAEAVRDLDTMGPEARSLYPKFLQALRQKDETIGPLALTALRRMGQPDKEWVGDLRELLTGPLPAARVFAAEALARLGADSLPALTELRKALNDTDPAVRRNVVAALASLGKDAREAADDLEKLAQRETDGEIKAEIIHALGKIDGKNKVVLQSLREAIAGSDSKARTAALKSLLDLGPEPDALEVCLKAYADASNRDLARAVLEKMKLGKDEAPLLVKALDDGNAEVRLLALSLLGRMKGEAGDLGPVLIKCLKDRDPRMRCEAALAVTALAPADKEVLAEAVPILIEPMKGVKSASMMPQNQPPPRPRKGFPPAQPPMKPANDGPRDDKVAQARDAIVRIGLPAVPALFKTLQDNGGDKEDEVWTRYQIYLTFAALGPKAYSFQNRKTLNAWAKKEQMRAARYNTVEIFNAALQAATSVRAGGS